MKRLALLLFILTTIFNTFSQDKSKIKELFLEAEYYLLYEDYREALPFYLQIDKTDYSNANIKYRLGICYLHSGFQKDLAIPYFEECIKNISSSYKEGSFRETRAPEDAYYFLAKAYRINNELDKAIDFYKKYKLTLSEKEVTNIYYVNEEIKSCENAKALQKSPIYINQINLSEPINGRFSNVKPVVSSDESVLIYTSKQKFYDAIYFSKQTDGKWSNPINITPQIGSDGEYYPSSISFDNKILVLYKEDIFGGDLYISNYDENLGAWLPVEKLPKEINSKYWETHGCYGPEGKIFYFTSNRLGGYGGMDIYKCDINENGEWTNIVNLGPEINTARNEETPFITEDGITLFFSSQGHYNMGGFDIFYSKMLEDNKWSKSLNIGFPINTTDDDMFFTPVNNGDFAYMADKSNRGRIVSDIYKLEFLSEQPSPFVHINGSIILQDNVTEFFDYFTLNVISLDNNKLIKENIQIDENGKYSLDLDKGSYQFVISGEDYEQKAEDIIIPEAYGSDELSITTELTPKSVSSGEHIIIKSIYFDFDDYSLNRDAKIELEKLAVFMNNYPELKIQVIGHADAIGTPEYNFLLSEKRAQAVIDYLIKKRINKYRFVATGEGEDNPIAINLNPDGTDNPEGRRYNRRVEIKVLSEGGEKIISQLYFIPEHIQLIEKELYYIVIANQSEKLSKEQLNKLKELNIEIVNQTINNNNLYYFGSFNEKSEALILLNDIISEGFNDAQLISTSELNELLNQ